MAAPLTGGPDMPTALDKTLEIVSDLIPNGHRNRPGTKIAITGITVHNTDNTTRGADAAAHGRFLSQVGYYMLKGQKHWVSWHYTVDEWLIPLTQVRLYVVAAPV